MVERNTNDTIKRHAKEVAWRVAANTDHEAAGLMIRAEISFDQADPEPALGHAKEAMRVALNTDSIRAIEAWTSTAEDIVSRQIEIEITVNSPTVPASARLSKEDVFGQYDAETHKRLSRGMIVARADEVCPVWADTVPYKSVTAVCDAGLVEDAIFWLEYVLGGDAVSRTKELPDGKVALRADYQCW